MLTDEHTEKLGLLNQLLIAGSQDQYVPSAHDREFLQRKFPNIYGTPKKTTPETRQLDIFGDHEKWKVKSTPNNHGMSIAHRDHTPNFRLDGIDRYITTDKHDPSQHDIPVDDHGNPLPGLTPTDLDIDKQNLPGNQINPQNYNKDRMLISNNYQPYDAAMDDLRLRRKQGKVSDNQWIKELQIINRTLYPKGV